MQSALDQWLEEIHSLEELFRFGGKCLKDPDLRTAFEFLSDCVEEAFPWEKQVKFLQSTEEHPNLDRDLSLFKEAENSTLRLSSALKPSPTEPIDLD